MRNVGMGCAASASAKVVLAFGAAACSQRPSQDTVERLDVTGVRCPDKSYGLSCPSADEFNLLGRNGRANSCSPWGASHCSRPVRLLAPDLLDCPERIVQAAQ